MITTSPFYKKNYYPFNEQQLFTAIPSISTIMINRFIRKDFLFRSIMSIFTLVTLACSTYSGFLDKNFIFTFSWLVD